MSNQTVTATFRSISNEAINSSGEIVLLSSLGSDLNKYFDLLIEVEWLSGPKEGQKGTLLCSHYCKWPKELLGKANFIEGCFTPPSYKGDRRLVLGYHAGSVTSYKWESEGVVAIKTILEEGEGDLSRTFQRGETALPTSKRFKAVKRIVAKWIAEAVNAGLTVTQGFEALEQRYENGEILSDVSPFLFSYVMATIEGVELTPNGSASQSVPEYGMDCEVNGNTVTVLRHSFKSEYFPAIDNQFMANGHVLHNCGIAGYWKAVEKKAEAMYTSPSSYLPYEYNEESKTLFVTDNRAEAGFLMGYPLDEDWFDSDMYQYRR